MGGGSCPGLFVDKPEMLITCSSMSWSLGSMHHLKLAISRPPPTPLESKSSSYSNKCFRRS